jgi:hypothetical protein
MDLPRFPLLLTWPSAKRWVGEILAEVSAEFAADPSVRS